MPSSSVWLVLAVLAGAHLRPSAAGYTPPSKYLIVTNARNGTIGYLKLPRPGENYSEVQPLVAHGLGHPQGIAVDQKRQLLIVADSDLRKVVSYGLLARDDGTLAVDEQTPLAESVDTRWVAVDGPGNVYFSDELGGKLLKISAKQILDGDTRSQPVYPAPNAPVAPLISAPGGIATDNFHVYWVNKNDGQKLGTVVKVLENGTDGNASLPSWQTQVLSKNLNKAYGMCLAIDNVWFTDTNNNLFAVKTNGGEVMTVSTRLQNPRGCTWDGEGTMYVADRTANGIFAFDGPMVRLSVGSSEAPLRHVAHFEDAFGLAVFSGAYFMRLPAALCLVLAVAQALMQRF